MVDTLWDKFDNDGSGSLDKFETKKFVTEVIGGAFDNAAFDEIFTTFDKDASGTVDKSEMVDFIGLIVAG